jgi:flavin reductase (DIM6/NTAB) family NADH-FMN oxidoreductase RutF
MKDPGENPINQALAQLPSGQFVLSGSFEGKRAGVLVNHVVQCASEPPLVCVCMEKGHWVSPIIRDSHHFGLSRIPPSERLMVRKFSEMTRPRDGDPFDCLAVERLVSTSPLLSRASLTLDCEVVRHLDLEADTEMFIGRVLAVRLGEPAKPS